MQTRMIRIYNIRIWIVKDLLAPAVLKCYTVLKDAHILYFEWAIENDLRYLLELYIQQDSNGILFFFILWVCVRVCLCECQ